MNLPKKQLAIAIGTLLLVTAAGLVVVGQTGIIHEVNNSTEWDNRTTASTNTSIENGSLTLNNSASSGSWTGRFNSSEERNVTHITAQSGSFHNWTAGSEILENPNDPMFVINPNTSTGYKFQMLTNDVNNNNEGDLWQSKDGKTWTKTHDSLYPGSLGDCRIKDDTYYCLGGKGWIWSGDSITTLTNTSNKIDVGEATWIHENGTWYVISGAGSAWNESCCVSNLLTLYKSDNVYGPYEKMGTFVNRSGTAWGTGDPYLIKIDGTYYVFGDKSSNHPYYHVALWTTDNLSGDPTNWTFQGTVTETYGGDPQIRYDDQNDTWIMMNEFADPPDHGVRQRESSGAWTNEVSYQVGTDTDGDGTIDTQTSPAKLTADYSTIDGGMGIYGENVSGDVGLFGYDYEVEFQFTGPDRPRIRSFEIVNRTGIVDGIGSETFTRVPLFVALGPKEAPETRESGNPLSDAMTTAGKTKVRALAWADVFLFNIGSRVPFFGDETTPAEQDAEAVQTTWNDNREDFRTYMNARYNATDAVTVVHLAFVRGDHTASVYWVAEANTTSGELTQIRVADETSHEVDETLIFYGAASAHADEDLRHLYEEKVRPGENLSDEFVDRSCAFYEDGDVGGTLLQEYQNQTDVTCTG